MPCEFDCAECGVHIVRFDCTESPYPLLCGLCLFLPGWQDDPELRRRLRRDAPPTSDPETPQIP